MSLHTSMRDTAHFLMAGGERVLTRFLRCGRIKYVNYRNTKSKSISWGYSCAPIVDKQQRVRNFGCGLFVCAKTRTRACRIRSLNLSLDNKEQTCRCIGVLTLKSPALSYHLTTGTSSSVLYYQGSSYRFTPQPLLG